jgi:hypothetical protein
VAGGAILGSGSLENSGGTIQGGGQIFAVLQSLGGQVLASDPAAAMVINLLSGGNPSSCELAVGAGAEMVVGQSFSNAGLLQLQGAGATFQAGIITNTGTVNGQGRILGIVKNSSGGTVEASGGRLTLDGTGYTNASGANIYVDNGAEVSFTMGLLANQGLISLDGGTFDNNNNVLNNLGQISGYGTIRTGGLTNNGIFTLTGGTSTVNGPVTNSSGQTINISYQPALFTGSVTNNGTIRVNGTTVTFTGTYSGNAYISDPSINIFQSNVSVTTGGSMSGSTGDKFYMTGGTFINQGTYTNPGLLQSSDPTLNSGTFTQGGVQIWSPGTVFSNTAGLATFQTDAGSSSNYPLSLNISGGEVAAGSIQHWAGLLISGSGQLDIANHSIFINYAQGADPISSIAAWVAEGYAGGAWNGSGIVSSMALSNPGYGIGYADSADPGDPAGLSSGTIEIIYTLLGDANLDGKVNGTDFNLMAANFNQSVTAGWDEGDFNYDGKVNGNDFVLLADNFNQFASQSAVSAADLAALDNFAVANGISLVNVPEPMSAGMMVMAGLGILRRRRRPR